MAQTRWWEVLQPQTDLGLPEVQPGLHSQQAEKTSSRWPLGSDVERNCGGRCQEQNAGTFQGTRMLAQEDGWSPQLRTDREPPTRPSGPWAHERGLSDTTDRIGRPAQSPQRRRLAPLRPQLNRAGWRRPSQSQARHIRRSSQVPARAWENPMAVGHWPRGGLQTDADWRPWRHMGHPLHAKWANIVASQSPPLWLCGQRLGLWQSCRPPLLARTNSAAHWRPTFCWWLWSCRVCGDGGILLSPHPQAVGVSWNDIQRIQEAAPRPSTQDPRSDDVHPHRWFQAIPSAWAHQSDQRPTQRDPAEGWTHRWWGPEIGRKIAVPVRDHDGCSYEELFATALCQSMSAKCHARDRSSPGCDPDHPTPPWDPEPKVDSLWPQDTGRALRRCVLRSWRSQDQSGRSMHSWLWQVSHKSDEEWMGIHPEIARRTDHLRPRSLARASDGPLHHQWRLHIRLGDPSANDGPGHHTGHPPRGGLGMDRQHSWTSCLVKRLWTRSKDQSSAGHAMGLLDREEHRAILAPSSQCCEHQRPHLSEWSHIDPRTKLDFAGWGLEPALPEDHEGPIFHGCRHEDSETAHEDGRPDSQVRDYGSGVAPLWHRTCKDTGGGQCDHRSWETKRSCAHLGMLVWVAEVLWSTKKLCAY